MAEENVKVAVRVRPFNQREKDASAKLIVSMVGNQTILTNPKTSEEKKFAFDQSYWSHDGFKDQSGYSAPDNPKYADQKKVFSDLGVGVLGNAWNGFNASLFAYGQTGSGKSYSVVGYGANKGIVPLVCEEIFNKKSSMKDVQIEVTFSMLEIYSEKVRDLLNPKTGKASLTIREDPKIGFYPQELQKTLVGSYADITKLTDEGTANRTIASTNMNATSSRAHTIVTVTLVQKYKNEAGKEMAKSSNINLVDLAGSERQESTGATGDRLKEGAAINLSLTSLGNVISALADNSAGKNVKVPYRDSVLTKLLMNALGGNSKTIMIAAISPADINFDETLSTLRYADRAKQIKTKAVVNEDPTEKLIHDLKAENAKLKEMLANGKADPALIASLSVQPNGASDSDILKKQLEENDKQMKAMQQSYEEKLAATQAMTANLESSKLGEKAKKTPHLSNVNMDPALSGTVKLLIEGDGPKLIGASEKSDIRIRGLGICDEHAVLEAQKGKFTINQRVPDAKIRRNGTIISSSTPVEIVHLDRLLFGASQFYQFIDPAKSSPKDVLFTFEMFQDETAKSTGLITESKRATMSPLEIQAQNELVDLLPALEEANMISIKLDKKVRFYAMPISSEIRGDYDQKIKAYVSMKNYVLGLEWIWTKEKFLNRKADMLEMYLDFQDDGVINRLKFKDYDPFVESPDTPTQIGTIQFNPMTVAYMHPFKTEATVINLKGSNSGSINIEVVPCNAKGQPITDKDNIVIRDPKTELLNKPISFIVKINDSKPLGAIYEDIFCQYTIMSDATLYKTDVIKGTNAPNFKHQKQFTFQLTPELIDFILNKPFYIQVFGEQIHPKLDPAKAKITTKEYFDRDGGNDPSKLVLTGGLVNKQVDPQVQKLTDELNLMRMKEAKYVAIIANVNQLIGPGDQPIPAASLKAALANMNDKGPAKQQVVANSKQKEAAGNSTAHAKPPANPDNKQSKTCTIV